MTIKASAKRRNPGCRGRRRHVQCPDGVTRHARCTTPPDSKILELLCSLPPDLTGGIRMRPYMSFLGRVAWVPARRRGIAKKKPAKAWSCQSSFNVWARRSSTTILFRACHVTPGVEVRLTCLRYPTPAARVAAHGRRCNPVVVAYFRYLSLCSSMEGVISYTKRV